MTTEERRANEPTSWDGVIPSYPPVFRRTVHGSMADLRLDSAIRRHVITVLEVSDSNLELAARELGVNRSTLRRWLHRWNGGELRARHREGRRAAWATRKGSPRASTDVSRLGGGGSSREAAPDVKPSPLRMEES